MTASQKSSGILLVVCPDQKGLVHSIAEFIYKAGGNILHSDQHQDRESDLFLMRVEWDMAGFSLSPDQVARSFGALAAPFGMTWRFELSARRQKVALFVSKYDHCLIDLLHRQASGELKCDIVAVISNHPDAQRLAQFYGVPFHHVPVTAATKDAAEKRQIEILRQSGAELIVLARYMQVLSEAFVDLYPSRIINVHHSFLPAFSGARPYHRAFERGVKLVGATSHYVTKDLDEGPIIEQDVRRVSHRDQLDELIEKGRDLEKAVLARAVKWHTEHRILMYGAKTVVFD